MNKLGNRQWTMENPESALEISSHLLVSQLHEYENVLRFYARHEHWMALTENELDDLRRLLVAMAGEAGKQNGYSYAENVLQKYNRAAIAKAKAGKG